MTIRENPPDKVLILGGGGHAKGLIEALRASYPETSLAVIDPGLSFAESVLGIPVIGTDAFIEAATGQGFSHFVVGVGGTGDNRPRASLFERACSASLKPLTICHPSAVIAASARLGAGTQVLFSATIGADSSLGQNVIVNSGAVVEHDCDIGDHSHIASGAVLAGNVRIGAYAHVGAGAVILEGRTVGPYAVVGAGAIVTRPVSEAAVVFGSPARQHVQERP